MLIELALAAFLTTRTESPEPPWAHQPQALIVPADLAEAIRKDIESISGRGTVDVSVDHETLFSVRIEVPSLRADICNPIYERELQLYRFFPDLNFDFYLWLKPGTAE